MRNRILCALFIVLLSAVALAQQPAPADQATHEQVVTLMNVMKAREQAKQMADVMIVQMLSMLRQQNSSMSEPEFAEFKAVVSDYMQKMPFDSMVDAMLPAYENNLTKAEAQAMIQFYSTPEGQSILAKMPRLQKESMDAMTPTLTKYMESIDAEMKAKIEQIVTKYHPAPTQTEQ